MRVFPGAFLPAFLSAALVWAQERPQDPKSGAFLQDVSLQDLTERVQAATRKTIHWNEELQLKQKRAHVVTDRPVLDNPELFFRLYQQILQVNELMLVPVGKDGEEAYKISPAATGARRAVPLVKAGGEPAERFVTRLFSLQHIAPRAAYAALAGLATNPQNVVPLEESGIVIVTDYDSNIARLEEVVRTIDVKRPDIEIRAVPLKNALASKVEEKMNALAKTLVTRASPLRPQTPGGQEPIQIVADDRTNSVLILAEPSRLLQLEDIARRLDVETPFESSGIHFAVLRHRNAVDVARTLNAMYRVSVDDRGTPSGGSMSRPTTAAGPPAVPALPSAPALPSTGAEPTIVADTASNSLLVITDRNTFHALEQIIRRLDQRRPQVFIKATVVEIATSEDFDLGVELARLESPKNRFVIGARTNLGLSGFQADPANNVFTITPVLSSGATLLGMKDRIGNIPALLHSLEGRAKISILDEPEAATSDNGTAKMTVTTEVPVSQTTVANTAGFTQAGFKYESAETMLQISPHISEAGYLRLDTTVRIQKFSGPSTDPQAPPGRASREISTREVLVPSGGTMVIGGIVTSDQTESVQGVPLLSHIPLLGWLFQRERESRERRTLYIFITPTILYDYAFGDYRDLTRDRKNGIERARGEPLPGLNVEPAAPREMESTFRFQSLRSPGRREP